MNTIQYQQPLKCGNNEFSANRFYIIFLYNNTKFQCCKREKLSKNSNTNLFLRICQTSFVQTVSMNSTSCWTNCSEEPVTPDPAMVRLCGQDMTDIQWNLVQTYRSGKINTYHLCKFSAYISPKDFKANNKILSKSINLTPIMSRVWVQSRSDFACLFSVS